MDQKPVVRFASVQDGAILPTRVAYGDINVVAHDPDMGSSDGDGIRWVTLTLTNADTGQFYGARREYWSTYDWGLRLRDGGNYVLTAYAVATRAAGGGWSKTSITVSSSSNPPPAPPTTQPPTTQPPTTQPPTTQPPTTQAPTTQAPTTQAPTTQPPTTQPPTTQAPTTQAPTTQAPTTQPPTTQAPTTQAPTTNPPTTNPPTTNPPTTQAPGGTGDGDAQQKAVLRLTNAERAKAGCGPVKLDPTLNQVATAHSEDMAANQYFDHTGLDGSQPWDRVRRAGYPARGSGENIAQGYRTAESVVAGWMSSPGHRRNILTCSWTEMGLGYAEGSSSSGNVPPHYWTQLFATRR